MAADVLILAQGKPFAFVFDLLEDDDETVLNLPANVGFRMHVRGDYADAVPLLSISSIGGSPRATKVEQTFSIAVPSSVTAAIAGPAKPANLVSDIELFDLASGECVMDGGFYRIAWFPEVTK